MVSDGGSRGILPLHLAVTADTMRSPDKHWNRSLIYHRKLFIDQLLEIDPSTVKCTIPGTRRFPLLEAIGSGLSWHIANNENGDIEKGPLQSLWKAAPEVCCHERDPVTGLLAFQLAAIVRYDDSGDKDAESEEEAECDIFQMDTIYNLLRLDPSAILR
jgi:hypothetical protein